MSFMNSLESWSSALFNGQWGCFAVSSRAGISWLTHQICIRHVDSSVMVITGFSAVPDPWSSWWMWGPSTGCITVRKSACPLWCWTSFWAHSSIACSIALTSFCYETITATCTSGYAFVGLYTSREQKYTHNNARMAGVASRNPDCKLWGWH